MQPHVIQSEAELQEAFKQLEAIFQAEEGTREFAEMQALVTRIEVYENTSALQAGVTPANLHASTA